MACTPLVTGDNTVVGIICGPGANAPHRRFYDQCPTCKRRRRFIARFDGLYYGETHTCCGCGDAWQDGYLLGRPARRGWRAEAIASAQRRWAAALTPRQYDAALRAEMDAHNAYTAEWADADEEVVQ